jgi:hypothetical protein
LAAAIAAHTGGCTLCLLAGVFGSFPGSDFLCPDDGILERLSVSGELRLPGVRTLDVLGTCGAITRENETLTCLIMGVAFLQRLSPFLSAPWSSIRLPLVFSEEPSAFFRATVVCPKDALYFWRAANSSLKNRTTCCITPLIDAKGDARSRAVPTGLAHLPKASSKDFFCSRAKKC